MRQGRSCVRLVAIDRTLAFAQPGHGGQPGLLDVALTNERKARQLARELPSFPFVRERYIEQAGLPSVAWLSERQRPIDGHQANA